MKEQWYQDVQSSARQIVDVFDRGVEEHLRNHPDYVLTEKDRAMLASVEQLREFADDSKIAFPVKLQRVTRDRYLTPDEAEKYNVIRRAIDYELPDLIARHDERMRLRRWRRTGELLRELLQLWGFIRRGQ